MWGGIRPSSGSLRLRCLRCYRSRCRSRSARMSVSSRGFTPCFCGLLNKAPGALPGERKLGSLGTRNCFDRLLGPNRGKFPGWRGSTPRKSATRLRIPCGACCDAGNRGLVAALTTKSLPSPNNWERLTADGRVSTYLTELGGLPDAREGSSEREVSDGARLRLTRESQPSASQQNN